MNNEIKELIKKITELLRTAKDPETRYYLVCAHNELMKIFNKND